MAIVTLTTDFGTRDWFVGSMKGVILSLHPTAQVVDITHELDAGDIHGGAWTLAVSYQCFPPGTVHVAVVDPGVGSTRAALVVRTPDYYFLGPDNGVLSWALRDQPIQDVRRIENTAWMRHPISRTFHGRDVFAPVAARLARGEPMTEVGRQVNDWLRLPWPQNPEILHIDRFGNAITNLRQRPHRLRVAGREVRIVNIYQEGAPGEPIGLMGSTGYLEIAINGGNAAATLGLRVGMRLEPTAT